ncbi:hypothetical protein ACHWQZ_G000467 [Mnemiopsis leidyi]
MGSNSMPYDYVIENMMNATIDLEKTTQQASQTTVEQTETNQQRKSSINPQPVWRSETPLISYEAIVWTIHIFICVVACLDRFYWNIWPRETYNIGKGSAGTDRIALLDGPWSVKFFDIIARVSGRFSILAMNLMFFVRLKTLESWLATSWISRTLIDCRKIVRANLRLHIWNGVLFCVLLLLHVWSILLPCLFHRYGAQVIPGYFEYPLSERTPPGFKDADSENKMMSLQVDDVFRMVEMTAILGVVIPLSNYWFRRRYHIAIHMHRIAAVIVFTDIVRRHSHPHSIILNSPVFFLWLAEKVLIRNQTELSEFHRIKLGSDYMAIFWKSSAPLSRSVGPNFFLRLRESSLPEPAHEFTSFQNRLSTQVPEIPGHWTTGVVMRVYHNRRKPPLSKTDNTSHTGRLFSCKTDSSTLEIRGPLPGEMSGLIKQAMYPARVTWFSNTVLNISPTEVMAGEGPVVLIGTGSGVNFLIDALQHPRPPHRQLVVMWSTRDTSLFNWVSDFFSQIVSPRETNLRIVLSNTDKSNVDRVRYPPGVSAVTVGSGLSHIITFVPGRINFGAEIPKRSHVFFQGSSKVGRVIREACRVNNSLFHKGTGGREVDDVTRKPPTVMKNPTVSDSVSAVNRLPTSADPAVTIKELRVEDFAYE